MATWAWLLVLMAAGIAFTVGFLIGRRWARRYKPVA